MPETTVAAIERTVQKTNAWLKDIMDRAGLDRQEAYSALRATLHAVRDRMPADAAAHLGAQLPLLIRGLYYDGFRPSEPPSKERKASDLADRIRHEMRRPADYDAERVARVVLAVLSEHITSGQRRHVEDLLPRDLREWMHS